MDFIIFLVIIVLCSVVLFCVPGPKGKFLWTAMRKIVLVLFLVWIGFVLGYLKYHNGAPRIEPHLVFAMRYISTFASENRKFPTTEEFKWWSGNNYANYGFEYYPDESNKAYVVGAWDGDAMQYFNSKTNKISYGKF